MTIIDLQRRLVQVGAIRIGTTVETDKKTRGGKAVRRPVRLETFRLTSADHLRLDAAAELYGGQVVEWDQRPGEFELVTEARELDVMVPPGQTISQWWELWGQRAANGPIECLRRCDGQTEHLNDSPCKCPIYDERAELAKDGKACKPTTRLSVILPRVPGIGTWRLVSHGVYAAIELAGVAEFLEGATARRAIVPARLRIDQRRAVRGGKTITW
ncbi:MAG: hypothetical protein FJX57_24045, partial [Alphaproteobacteria bacterium]|nr:hypothetical protein [Alphaproteobacteria bacterium]